jgi:antitoxin (DNA-binding transcriptional repressor) of toxin-antitoxin stability system
MPSVTVQELQADFLSVLSRLQPGEELCVLDGERTVAWMTKPSVGPWPSVAGSAKSRKFWMAPDFDAPLDDFKEYME